MSCCWTRQKTTKDIPKNLTMWQFHHGSSVMAASVYEAVEKLSKTSMDRFWASETDNNVWDVQFSDDVIVYNVHADSVIEAVKKARWSTHLDHSFKKLKL